MKRWTRLWFVFSLLVREAIVWDWVVLKYLSFTSSMRQLEHCFTSLLQIILHFKERIPVPRGFLMLRWQYKAGSIIPGQGCSVSNSWRARCKSPVVQLFLFKNGKMNSLPLMTKVSNRVVIRTILCTNSFPECIMVEQLWSSISQRHFEGSWTTRVKKPKSTLVLVDTKNEIIIIVYSIKSW